LSVKGLSLSAEFFKGAKIPLRGKIVETFECLTFDESFLTDRLGHHSSHEFSNDAIIDVLQLVMLKNFRYEGQGFLGVVASEVVDLLEYLFVIEWKQFVEEDCRVMAIGLAKMS
jgi:hypothetical protein